MQIAIIKIFQFRAFMSVSQFMYIKYSCKYRTTLSYTCTRISMVLDSEFLQKPFLRYPPGPETKLINQTVLTLWEAKPFEQITKGDHLEKVTADNVTMLRVVADGNKVVVDKTPQNDVTMTHCIVSSMHYGTRTMTVIGCVQTNPHDV